MESATPGSPCAASRPFTLSVTQTASFLPTRRDCVTHRPFVPAGAVMMMISVPIAQAQTFGIRTQGLNVSHSNMPGICKSKFKPNA